MAVPLFPATSIVAKSACVDVPPSTTSRNICCNSVADAGLAYRTKEEIEERRHQDPLARTRESLEARGVPVEGIEALDAEVGAEVEAAVSYAEADEAPSVDGLDAGVYAAGSEEQFERMRPGSPAGEEELVFAGGLGR